MFDTEFIIFDTKSTIFNAKFITVKQTLCCRRHRRHLLRRRYVV